MPALTLRAPRLVRAPWLVLAAMIAVAAAVFALAGRGIPTPWILIDELVYAGLARSLWAGHGFTLRGHGVTVSWTYPALLAPVAWSYGAMKAVNAVVVALTAVPVFLWARRLVSPLSALVPVLLTLLLPLMLLSSTIMLNNPFMPLFVAACFVCALALERPTLAWQAAALAAIGLATATRFQGLVLVPVFALSALTLRRVRALLPALAVCGVVAIVTVARLASGGLGVYEGYRSAHYSAGATATWLLRSAGDLSLAAGILPVAALLSLRPRTERERAFGAVAAWTTVGHGWGLLPFERAGLTAARVLLVGGTLAAAALFLFAPRLAVVAVAAFLAASTAVVYSTIRNQSRSVLAVSGLSDRRWVDHAARGPVTYLNATAYEQETSEGRWFEEWVPVWETEFWNRRFAGVLTLANALEPAPFFQRHGSLDWSSGRVSGAGGVRYLLVDPRFVPVGRLVASSGRLALYSTSGPLRLASATEGVHADGTTTGLAAYDRWAGRGRVTVTTSAPATVAIGRFAAVPGGGGRIAGARRVARVDGTATFTRPVPLRVEVRAPAGTRVSFAAP
jgi:hypothetical protein